MKQPVDFIIIGSGIPNQTHLTPKHNHPYFREKREAMDGWAYRQRYILWCGHRRRRWRWT